MDNIDRQAMITPYGRFNETFSFILTDQEDILFEQYNLDSNNYPKLIQTIPINFSNLKGSFNIIDDLSYLKEVVTYMLFNNQQFSMYFYPNSTQSMTIFIYDGKNLDGDILKPPDLQKIEDLNLQKILYGINTLILKFYQFLQTY